MKVLLMKDVYKLGRAGDVKKVADGYGRNFLIPQGMAVLATEGALKQADRIRQKAVERRVVVNEEMGVVAEALAKIQLTFGARAGETGKLYGSITSQDVADQIQQKSGHTIKRQQLDMQPLRTLGEHIIRVRLTMDLIPELTAIVFREGEAEPSLPIEPEPVKQGEPEPVKTVEPEPVKPVEPEPVKPVEPEPVKPVEPEPLPETESLPPEEAPADPAPEA